MIPTNWHVLFRFPLALLAASSAAAAALAASRALTPAAGTAFLGVFLLAGAASALNQVQEQDLDRRMERTRRRPLAAGTMDRHTAGLIVLVLFAAGAFVLSRSGWLPLLLGIAAIALYNGFYTPLKRTTALAAPIGSLVGAIPPAIGWTAAGAPFADARLFALSMLFVLWQVPHFWLLLLRREQEYRAAGLPVFTDILPPARLRRIALLWTAATAVIPLFLPLFGIIHSTPAIWSLILLVSLMTAHTLRAGLGAGTASFSGMNAFLAGVLVVIALDAVLPGAFL